MTIEQKKIKLIIEQFKDATNHLDPADERIKKLKIDFVRAASHVIEAHPGVTSGQSKYIATKTLLVADAFSMSEDEKQELFYASLLVQIGKICLPDRLLAKPFYSLTVADRYSYFGHALDGADLLQELTHFKGVTTLIRHQYEHYSGQGFPDGLAGRNIPLGSRIISVVKAYIAYLNGSMTGNVIYADAARSKLMIRRESHYDPEIVSVFINVLMGKTADEIKDALANSRRHAVATERWRKGLAHTRKESLSPLLKIVEIALPQLKVGMKVDSIYFGREPYIRQCIVDQSILDNVCALTKSKGKSPIIKVFLDMMT